MNLSNEFDYWKAKVPIVDFVFPHTIRSQKYHELEIIWSKTNAHISIIENTLEKPSLSRLFIPYNVVIFRIYLDLCSKQKDFLVERI